VAAVATLGAMRPFPIMAAAAVMTLLVTAAVVHPERWFGDTVLIGVVTSLAAAFVAFNWWELWSTRHDR
jgi:hypothetical protein